MRYDSRYDTMRCWAQSLHHWHYYIPNYVIDFVVWPHELISFVWTQAFDNDNLIRFFLCRIFYRPWQVREKWSILDGGGFVHFSIATCFCLDDLGQGEFKGKLIIKKFSCSTLKEIFVYFVERERRAKAQGMSKAHIKSLNCDGIFYLFNVSFLSTFLSFLSEMYLSRWNLSDN